MGFDPGFEHPTCLATLKSSDRTKQSVCGWLYNIYIYIYNKIEIRKMLQNGRTNFKPKISKLCVLKVRYLKSRMEQSLEGRMRKSV